MTESASEIYMAVRNRSIRGDLEVVETVGVTDRGTHYIVKAAFDPQLERYDLVRLDDVLREVGGVMKGGLGPCNGIFRGMQEIVLRHQSYVLATADRCSVYPQHVMVDTGYSPALFGHQYRCACGKEKLGNTKEIAFRNVARDPQAELSL